ncbi:MAG: M3 family oligoendopeptidase [Alphaproteobacteria bacterium]|nr:M3 family oligoendopeptidase [Alphaproteobacteria bacterium]MBU1516243.1 M3 family oligoendopeptidase [Alphaproteobacteria bacterium]MBU2095780.1 M3 family oligoendopeptidase [Alphaproteobacteria bacterium]MBU2151896.1 M3 family oligoendopeptidase [Alphaproteobacteria bacterium]MBU2306821.1 M3 family oligoendopeptidase [Alphaproteobacteria bacterium]
MNAPFKTDALPEWRLDDLYTGRDDPRIEADLGEAERLNGELAKLEGRLIATRSRPAELGGIIDRGIELYEQATNAMWSVGAFGSLSASVARDDPAWSKFEADLRMRASQIGQLSLFFTLEINQLDDVELEAALKANKSAQRWRPWLRRVRAGRPHELSAELEKLLLDKAPATANWGRLSDETLAKLSAKVGGETLTLSDLLNRMSSPDAAQRKAAAAALSKALGERTPTLALCLNTLAFEKQVEDRWRKLPTPASGRHLANEVDADAVDALEAAVVESYATVSHRYYALKAKALGRPHLDHWDRNSPLDTAQPRIYSWEQAKSTVLESFSALAPQFAQTAQTFFTNPWIDARPRPGKQSGAYSHSVTAPRHPYVFMNYMGERRDVLTLAHELGHAVHQTLCRPLGTLLADTPLTLAETASIFGEGLVFEKLLAEASPAEKRGLLAGKIEDGINTVVRQIAFHRFESRFHAARLKGELSADEIGDLWMEIMAESLGPAVRLDKGYRHYWAYISHFVHSPFYVYAYAFGDLLVRGLMEKRREDPVAFAPLYEKLLAGGGTKTYVEALGVFGLNPREKAFWAAGMRQLERLVDEFEALV